MRPLSRSVAPGPDFFDDAYVRVLEPFHTEEEARYETAALRELLGLAQGDRLLDLGCGWGRHLGLLDTAGHDVVGLDLSLAFLRRAREESVGRTDRAHGEGRGPAPPLVAGDMRRLPLTDATFDVVLNLATSLGLFLDDAPAREALREVGRVLRPGGRLLLEGMHRADVEAGFAPRDAWTLDDGTEVRARRRFDPVRGVSHEVLRWDGPGGSGTKRHSLRIRSAGEVERLLERVGLRVLDRRGDWTGEPFGRRSPRMIMVAERPRNSYFSARTDATEER
ncbi:MAG: class I SAM-dependent methyltransferase [Candidatus Longimicrobiales bacterium M2_2A_002]